MAEYRLYFLDGQGAIEARHEFRAERDADAVMLASIVAETVSDGCARYELWDHARCLVSTRDSIGALHKRWHIHEVDALRQRNLLDLEETFRQSHWHLARSRKLLDAIDDLRARCAAKPVASARIFEN